MAASLPDATLVSCDLSPRAITAAGRTGAELGLTNVTLLRMDLRELPATLGDFDCIMTKARPEAIADHSSIAGTGADTDLDNYSRQFARRALLLQ